MQFGELGEPTFIDEAEVLPEEVERHFADAVRAAEADAALEEAVDDAFGIERADRLPLPPRSGPRLDPQTTARVGRRLQQERLEADELRRIGLLPEEGTE